jgi:hypothetical protein
MKEIKSFTELKKTMESNLMKSSEKRIKALKTLMKFQTESEQKFKSTHCMNGEGFTKADAKVLSSLHDFYKNKGKLTPKQDLLLAKKIKKYAGQLCKISMHRKLIQKIGGKYVWGQQLDAMTVKNLKKKDIAHAAREWINN